MQLSAPGTAFFGAVRKAPFGGRMSAEQVRGVEAILRACHKYRVTDPHHIANILAQVFHETGTYMLPIKETVYASHKDKNPSDAAVIARLDAAWKNGQLSWVKTPYWRDGWFGRGPIQLTHQANYEKIGKAIGVDLVSDKNRILDPDIGAATAVVGMRDGLFTGKKLDDYDFPAALNAPTKSHPRRIVNGNDGTDAKISGYHRDFHKALVAAGYQPQPFVVDDPGPKTPPAPQPVPAAPVQSFWTVLGAVLARFFRK
jgi:hypothetical protein